MIDLTEEVLVGYRSVPHEAAVTAISSKFSRGRLGRFSNCAGSGRGRELWHRHTSRVANARGGLRRRGRRHRGG